ncbi:MAG: aminoacyl-histidine dipeptidase [Clostridiales bacterium]|nr:aminoacyl-histidine dipeptidase [Clostridiales bacterium]
MSKEKALDIVLSEFLKLASVPRPSHHEERVSEYLYQWAKNHGLAVEKDSMNEIIIDKPASPGCENVPRVIFQAHMDMVCVCEKGITYDPMNDPIKVINDGVTLTAEGTSLGADDGIGVAMCLYLLQDNTLRHGPIRAVFTTNEEDGMDSMAIDPKYLEGNYLVNLDWETLGSLCNSCAGGDFFNYSHSAEWETPVPGSKTLSITFNNLLGGHSGVGINKGHANALVSIATLLSMLQQGGVSYRIASFSGGQAKNAIPAFGSAAIAIAADEETKAREIISVFRREFEEAFGNIEENMAFTAEITNVAPARVLTGEIGYGMVGLMTTVPNNVHTMSPFIDGLVESSANLGVVSVDDEMVRFTVFARSSVAYQATQIGVICAALASSFGFSFDSEGHVPGWSVNPNSKLTHITCDAYQHLTGTEMVVEPVHAGVECGAFAEKNPNLDMIAIGPTLLDVHTPKESCKIEDVKITTELLIEILERIAQ